MSMRMWLSRHRVPLGVALWPDDIVRVLEERESHDSRSREDGGISRVGRHDRTLHQPEREGLEELRRSRYRGMPAVERIISSLSVGRQDASEPEALTRPLPGSERELRTRQCSMGDYDRATEESASQRAGALHGSADTGDGSCGARRHQAVVGVVSSATRMDRRPARSSIKEEASLTLSRHIARAWYPD